MFIPGELVALVTFPGVILHEIAHRFFCDVSNTSVYEVHYFKFWSRTAGHVIFQPTENVRHAFFISYGPLIINSLVCMILTFPAGCRMLLGTEFLENPSTIYRFLEYMMVWIGYSAGFNAIPSNKDVEGLHKLAQSKVAKAILYCMSKAIFVINLPLLQFIFGCAYAVVISALLPAFLLSRT